MTRNGRVTSFPDRHVVKERFAEALVEERLRLGLSQPATAKLIGYSLRQYQRFEDPRDQGLPSLERLKDIIDRLGLDLSFPQESPATKNPLTVEQRLDRVEKLLKRIAKAVGA